MLVMFEDIGESQEISALLKTGLKRINSVYIENLRHFVCLFFAWRKKKVKKLWEENCYDRTTGILRIENRKVMEIVYR